MSTLIKLAWPIQIIIFVLLLFFLPHNGQRFLILMGYIVISAILIRVIRSKYS